MFFYRSHLGGIYACDRYLLEDELTCLFCGEKDFLLGYAETEEDASLLLKITTKHPYDYIQELVYCVFTY